MGAAARDLTGAVVCITGAGRGIGKEAALLMAAKGAVVHVGDVDIDAAREVAGAISAAGGRGHAHACDVSSEQSVAALFAAIAAAGGRLDVLVNNAGIYPKLDFFATTVADFDRVMGVNVRGAFMCTMAAAELMAASGGGSIVCLSSSAGTLESLQHETARTLPLYGAAKAALDRWALNAAGYLASRNIAVNVLYPAGILTDGSRALGLREDYVATMRPPSVVAPAIAWLARQTPATFTGQLVRSAEFGTAWGGPDPGPAGSETGAGSETSAGSAAGTAGKAGAEPEVLLAIHEVLSRYAQVIDDGAWDALTEVFTDGAVIDHTPIGSAHMTGIDEAAAAFAAGMRRRAIAHHLTNPVVLAVRDGGRTVRVRSKWLVVDADGRGRSGYYLDDFVRTAGGWRISNRRATPRFPAT
ncbi:SDR family NAD(P)-dependent oxidoreductase [Dactylosporangium sp. NPDC050688]|uniref:SDR family NAD(P)-dependent oxidoreductase n=1 Tax=Dactylosporangium sp. NPDC050688 TaxID=3157217 RepID=UPI0033CCB08F